MERVHGRSCLRFFDGMGQFWKQPTELNPKQCGTDARCIKGFRINPDSSGPRANPKANISRRVDFVIPAGCAVGYHFSNENSRRDRFQIRQDTTILYYRAETFPSMIQDISSVLHMENVANTKTRGDFWHDAIVTRLDGSFSSLFRLRQLITGVRTEEKCNYSVDKYLIS